MKKAFTLAEVLITLGIIGVVAAMTIPTLISNYQKKQWVAGLQKAYSQFSQAFKLLLVDEGVDSYRQLGLQYDTPAQRIESVKTLTRHMKVLSICGPSYSETCHNIDYKNLNNGIRMTNFGNQVKVVTSDGVIYYFIYYSFLSGAYSRMIAVDVNGTSGPNEAGRDLFYIYINDNGTVTLRGTTEYVDDDGIAYGWNPEEIRGGDNCNPDDGEYGGGCAGRILEKGWVMDY